MGIVTETDPTVIRSIAVTSQDVVAAAETNQTSDRRAVLRITPPFSGRMRARLHVLLDENEAGAGEEDSPAPIHLDPEAILDADAPAYPRPAETEDELRVDPDQEYSVDRHREYHTTVVESWRDSLPEYISDRVTLQTGQGSHDIEVAVLG